VHLLLVPDVALVELGAREWLLRLVPGARHDGAAGVRQRGADSGPDTTHAAGDEGNGAVQLELHAC
jgi:hypothetical protein